MITFNEKDLEDLIFQDLQQGGSNLRLQGFELTDEFGNYQWRRQVNLKCGHIPDIIGYRRTRDVIETIIIELKNRPIISADFNQILSYEHSINNIIHETFKGTFMVAPAHLVLIGTDISDGHYIHNAISIGQNIDLYSFELTINGLRVKEKSHGKWSNPKVKGVTIRDLNLNKA
jgi:hypothetical protein